MDRGGPARPRLHPRRAWRRQRRSRGCLPPELGEELAEASAALAALDGGIETALAAALGDDLPLLKRDGGFVRPGRAPELDEMRALRDDSPRHRRPAGALR